MRPLLRSLEPPHQTTVENHLHGKLQLEKQIMQEKVANCGRPLRGFDESFRTAMDFLANQHELWASGRIEDRHAVMKLTFADRLAYVRGEGF